MQVDKEALVKLLEAFVETSEILQRELMLYQLLFTAACKAKGLIDSDIQQAVTRAREKEGTRIKAATQANYLALVGKLPRLVDLLASGQDEALRFLKEWQPKGPPI